MGTGCSVAVAYGRRTGLWQRATPVTVGWFAIRTVCDNLQPKLMCNFLGASLRLFYKQSGGGRGVRQNTTVLYPIYYGDGDMFRPLWTIFRSQKCVMRRKCTEYDHSVGAYCKLYRV